MVEAALVLVCGGSADRLGGGGTRPGVRRRPPGGGAQPWWLVASWWHFWIWGRPLAATAVLLPDAAWSGCVWLLHVVRRSLAVPIAVDDLELRDLAVREEEEGLRIFGCAGCRCSATFSSHWRGAAVVAE